MINKIVKIVDDFKTALQKDEAEDSLLDKIVIVDGYHRELAEQLLREEHDRKVNIYNLDNYLTLKDRNEMNFKRAENVLYERHGKHYQKEVFKEVALDLFLRKYTINEIDELIKKHESKKQIRRFGE